MTNSKVELIQDKAVALAEAAEIFRELREQNEEMQAEGLFEEDIGGEYLQENLEIAESMSFAFGAKLVEKLQAIGEMPDELTESDGDDSENDPSAFA